MHINSFLQLLCGALNSCVSELRLQLNDTETVASLPWIHAAYHEFKNRLQNLSRVMSIAPQLVQNLLIHPNARDGAELVSVNLFIHFFKQGLEFFFDRLHYNFLSLFVIILFWTFSGLQCILIIFPLSPRYSMCMLVLHVWSSWSPQTWALMPKGKCGSGRWKKSRFLSSWSARRTVWDVMERGARWSSGESSKSVLSKAIQTIQWRRFLDNWAVLTWNVLFCVSLL